MLPFFISSLTETMIETAAPQGIMRAWHRSITRQALLS